MNKTMFDELLQSVQQALEFEQGKRTLKTTVVRLAPAPMAAREVKRVRETLHASQAIFASYLNVSPKLVQAWEGSRRAPDGAALVLLRLIEREPRIVDSLLKYPPVRKRSTGRAKSRHKSSTPVDKRRA